MEEIKKCPFCGNEAETDVFSTDFDDWQVSCLSTGCRGNIPMEEGYENEEMAIKEWNTRKL